MRGVVLGAQGPVFSAGHDLRELATRDPAVHERVFAACAELMLTIHRLPQPVVARVQGMATAAGCQLVAACDLAVAAEAARFATPGVKIGLFCTTPDGRGGARRRPHARDGDAAHRRPDRRPHGARTGASSTGSCPLEHLDDEAAALAARVAAASGETARDRQARRRTRTSTCPLEEAYRHASAVMCRNAVTDDAQEGIAAFLEKRPPVWSR